MTQPPTLTGQNIAEAQGAITRVLEKALASAGATRHEYVARLHDAIHRDASS